MYAATTKCLSRTYPHNLHFHGGRKRIRHQGVELAICITKSAMGIKSSALRIVVR